MDFEAVFTNGECYILELKEGGAALVNLFSGRVDRGESVDKYLRLGVYEEIRAPLPPEELERLDCLLHGRPLPRAKEGQGTEEGALDRMLERLKKEMRGRDYVTFREVSPDEEEDSYRSLLDLEEPGENSSGGNGEEET